MRFLSVCSGIEAASVAWNPLGWHAAAFAEIEPFPCSVLAHHYPTVPNWGDMTKFKDWPDATVDLLCGGTPCQSFSVAGLRKGLDDPRGNLMLTYGAIAASYRPKWLVWENVPGVLSSDGGRDFGTFLGLLGILGYGFAYRVLDAQFFGVPQRRRRVFVVGCLGDWRSAAAVLFERHSLSGHPAPRREARERTAPTLDASFGRLQGCSGQDANHGHGHLVAFGGNDTRGPIEVATARNACASASGRMDFESETFLVAAAFSQQAGGTQTTLGYDPHSGQAPTLAANQTPAVAIEVWNGAITGEVAATLGTRGSSSNSAGPQLMEAAKVRRLTPEECEALQGFPRRYTAVLHRGKPAADGPRYKALGNSWAVPCARWIGQRINQVEALHSQREEIAA
jgi:DNA (cytosine-5)-methyltransferase 1